MMLKQLVEELATEAERLDTIETSAPALTSLWVRGVNTLHDRVEGIYLLDYLFTGQVKLAREPVWNYAARLGRFEINALRIRVGKRHLVLRPEYRPADARLGVVVIETNGGAPAAQMELSLRADGALQWTVPAAGSLLQRLLRPLLPARTVPLDEGSFTLLMERVLLGRQPVFTGNGDLLRARLADLVDRASEVRRDAQLGQVAAQVWQRSLHLTGRVRRSAQAMLPAPKRPRLTYEPAASPRDEHPSAG